MRIAIVDDEAEQRQLLAGYVSEFAKQKQIRAECVEFASCLDFVSDYKVPFDVILLDIEMPEMDGLAAAKKLREVDTRAVIIFVTNMAQYAINGYEVDAMDFMVKPVSYFNLSLKLNKALRYVSRQKSFVISAGGTTVVLGREDIYYVEGHNQYVVYHTGKGEYKVHASLKATEESLGGGFSRCNNSFIVNLMYVSATDANSALVAGERLPMSRARKKSFTDDLNRFLGGLQ